MRIPDYAIGRWEMQWLKYQKQVIKQEKYMQKKLQKQKLSIFFGKFAAKMECQSLSFLLEVIACSSPVA